MRYWSWIGVLVVACGGNAETSGEGGGAGEGHGAGQCDSGAAGFAGAFHTPGIVMCMGNTPGIADKKGFPVYLEPCSGETPVCDSKECDASTDPMLCCNGSTPTCSACPSGMVSTGTSCIDSP